MFINHTIQEKTIEETSKFDKQILLTHMRDESINKGDITNQVEKSQKLANTTLQNEMRGRIGPLLEDPLFAATIETISFLTKDLIRQGDPGQTNLTD